MLVTSHVLWKWIKERQSSHCTPSGTFQDWYWNTFRTKKPKCTFVNLEKRGLSSFKCCIWKKRSVLLLFLFFLLFTFILHKYFLKCWTMQCIEVFIGCHSGNYSFIIHVASVFLHRLLISFMLLSPFITKHSSSLEQTMNVKGTHPNICWGYTLYMYVLYIHVYTCKLQIYFIYTFSS